MPDLSELEQRLTRLEDIEAIKQLKALYCEICDDNHDPERIVTVFTDDGIWEGRGIGTARGHGEIRELFEGFQKAMSYSHHMTMNPRIEVNGDQASGTWYFFGPFTFRKHNRARWQATRYQEDYAKVDGEWKIRHLRILGPSMTADYESGWAS